VLKILFFLLAIFGNAISCYAHAQEPTLHNLHARTGEIYSNQYGYTVIGFSEGADPDRRWNTLGIYLQGKGRYKRDEVRKLLWEFRKILLEEVNASIDAECRLNAYPFENVDITIHFKDEEGRSIVEPYVSSATWISKCVLYYYRTDPCEVGFSRKDRETFQEALDAITPDTANVSEPYESSERDPL